MRKHDDLANLSPSIEQVLALLHAAPARLASLTENTNPAALRTPPAAGEWSAVEVLAHLRSCADVWGGGITAILAKDRPTFRAVDPRTWMKSTNYVDLEFRPSLEAFTTQRGGLLAVLDALPPADWLSSAVVTGAGRPLERTVHFYAQWLARHERTHLKQIERLVS